MVDRVVVVAFTKVDFDLYGYSGPFQCCNEDSSKILGRATDTRSMNL